MFKYELKEFVANVQLSLSEKEFWKSVNIWGSYGQEFSVLFFLTHCRFLLLDSNHSHKLHHFTARCYASVVLAVGLCMCLSVCVCLSVTSRSSTKTAKRRITQTTPHDSRVTLVFWCQRPRSPPTRAPNAGGVGQNRRLLTNNRLCLENSTR